MSSLLSEKAFTAVGASGEAYRLSLPEAFAALAADRVAAFPALRPHQAPAFHAFLVQVAAMGCEALDLDHAPGDDPAAWADVLRALTREWPEDEPWRLVTAPDKPAFMQPPVPGGGLDDFDKDLILTPDALDMLVTSKNHDLKAERIVNPQVDDWVFALISLQTQEGQMGKGNYGVARMNGGYSSRSYVRLTPEGGSGAGVMRDVAALLKTGPGAWSPPPIFAHADAKTLLWTLPWDGKEQLSLNSLHPLFVECCRRVRLVEAGDRIAARKAGSEMSRISAKELRGVLGDPWAPIDETEGAKALSITAEGFSYRKVVELLFRGGSRSYRLPYLASPQHAEKARPMRMELAALTRGMGKTEGFHRRCIEMPTQAMNALGSDSAARRAWEQIGAAGDVWSKALRPAILALLQSGPESVNWADKPTGKLADAWQGNFEARVDQVFFHALWASLELDQDAAARAWAVELSGIARTVFSEVRKAAPQRSERRFLSEARSEALFRGGLRKALPSLTQAEETTDG